MDFNTLLSNNGTIEQLKCAKCENLLSYFPIYNCNNRNICGRCTLQEKPYFRNDLYEFIAQYLKFPCRYENQGCDEKNFPADTPNHETKCPYKIIRCSVQVNFSQCDWKGSRFCLLQHIQDKHAYTFIENSGFKIDLTRNNEKTYFMKRDNVLLYVKTQFNFVGKYFECSIYHMEDETDNVPYPYTFTLKNGTRCVSVQVITSKFSERRLIDISLEPLRSRSEDFPPQAIGEITFGENSTGVNVKTLENLKDLQCSICLKFVVPPIYQCSSKHFTLCSECLEEHLSSCETCTQLLHVIHSSGSLESDRINNISNLLNHFCKNKKRGCLFMARADKLEQHEKCCPFKEVKCQHYNFEECDWKGSLKNLTSHIEQDHENKIKECTNNSLLLKCESAKASFVYQRFFKCFNSFFKLIFLRKNNQLKWLVQTIGKGDGNFYYEIELVSDTAKKFKWVARCSPLIKKKTMHYTSEEYTVHMYLDQIMEFMRNGSLTYQLKIVPKKITKDSKRDHNDNTHHFIRSTIKIKSNNS